MIVPLVLILGALWLGYLAGFERGTKQTMRLMVTPLPADFKVPPREYRSTVVPFTPELYRPIFPPPHNDFVTTLD